MDFGLAEVFLLDHQLISLCGRQNDSQLMYMSLLPSKISIIATGSEMGRKSTVVVMSVPTSTKADSSLTEAIFTCHLRYLNEVMKKELLLSVIVGILDLFRRICDELFFLVPVDKYDTRGQSTT